MSIYLTKKEVDELFPDLKDMTLDLEIPLEGKLDQFGKNNPFYGMEHTEESKSVMSAKKKGNKNRLGCNHTEETKAKMSAAHKNKKRTEETKARMSQDWVITYPDGREEEISNLAAFCREHNLNGGNMCSVASGKYNHHKGWKAKKV